MLRFFSSLIFSLGFVIAAPAFTSHASSASSSAPQVVPNVGHSATATAFSRDGQLMASGEYDGRVRIWDCATGRLLRTLERHSETVLSLAFVADSRQLLSASKDLSVKRWDVATGELLRTMNLPSPAIRTTLITLSPDGSRIATSQRIGQADHVDVIKIWDLASGAMMRSFSANPNQLAFTADNRRLISGGTRTDNQLGGQVYIWDIGSGQLIRRLDQKGGIYNIALSSNGSRLLTQGLEFGRETNFKSRNGIALWDIETGRNLRSWSTSDTVVSIALSPDAALVVLATFPVGSNVNTLNVWDATDGNLLHTTQRPSAIKAMTFRPNTSSLLFFSERTELIDARTGKLERFLGARRLWTGQNQFVNDGSSIVTGGQFVGRFDYRSGQLLGPMSPPPTGIGQSKLLAPAPFALAHSEDGNRILWRMRDSNTLVVADGHTNRVISTMSHAKLVMGAAISRDAAEVLSAAQEPLVSLWDATRGSLVRSYPIPGQAYSAAFSPDGTKVAGGNVASTVRLWDKASGQLLWTYKEGSDNYVWSLTFSHDGKLLLAAISDLPPRLIDVATGRLIKIFTGHKPGRIVDGAAFSPDDRRMITTSHDGTARLWEVSTGTLLHTFEVGSVSYVNISRDGKRVLLDNAVWDLETRQKLVTIFSPGNDEFLAITPEGYFAGSKAGAEMLSVVRGVEAWSIDQFYQALYRPDLVREKLTGDVRGLVRQAARDLDLEKAVASGSPPDVRLSFPGRALGQGSVDSASASLQAEIVDRGGGIGRVEWRVNGVTAGIDEPAAGPASPVRLSRNVQLDRAENVIEVTAYNGANLIASTPAKLDVTVRVAAPSIVPPPQTPSVAPAPPPVAAVKPRLFVLVAGVNDYADQRIKLTFAVPDAREVARAFQEASGNLYRSVAVKLMTDKDVVKDKLDAAFAEMASQTEAADVFVVYLAGHGKTVDGRYYFIPQDLMIEGELSDMSINTAVKAKAIAQDQWQRWFASVPARKSVILFDTCDSGTLAGDETQELERTAANDRLAQATGRSILAASGGKEEAIEGYRGHGLFTYQVLDAINRSDGDNSGTVELNELAAYVYGQVSEISQKVFKQRQVPQMRITSNYPLAKPTRILMDEVTPIAEGKPAQQLAKTASVQVQPGIGATVVRSLDARTSVTVLESRNGWSLIAAEGKPLGYVATRDLAPAQ